MTWRKEPLSNFWAGLAPLVYLAAVAALDHYISPSTISPAMCSLGLLVMSFWLPMPWMFTWVLIYTAYIFTVFNIPSVYIFTHGKPFAQPDISVDFRIFTFFCVGLFCTCFFYLINRLFITRPRDLNDILSCIPEPLVVSDEDGRIVFCNNRVTAILGISELKLKGQSFFKLFVPEGHHGSAVSGYMRLIEELPLRRSFPCQLGTATYSGSTILLHSFNQKLLVTIFRSPSRLLGDTASHDGLIKSVSSIREENL
jgi:PAS domain S-box-containing protein